MDDLTKKHLYDVLTAIGEIEGFFGGRPKLFDDFCGNPASAAPSSGT